MKTNMNIYEIYNICDNNNIMEEDDYIMFWTG